MTIFNLQMVHVLANTVVVIPFMNWDVGIRRTLEKELDSVEEGECDCLLKRSASVNAIDSQPTPKSKGTISSWEAGDQLSAIFQTKWRIVVLQAI